MPPLSVIDSLIILSPPPKPESFKDFAIPPYPDVHLDDLGRYGINVINRDHVRASPLPALDKPSGATEVPIITVNLLDPSECRYVFWFTRKVRRDSGAIIFRSKPSLKTPWDSHDTALTEFCNRFKEERTAYDMVGFEYGEGGVLFSLQLQKNKWSSISGTRKGNLPDHVAKATEGLHIYFKNIMSPFPEHIEPYTSFKEGSSQWDYVEFEYGRPNGTGERRGKGGRRGKKVRGRGETVGSRAEGRGRDRSRGRGRGRGAGRGAGRGKVPESDEESSEDGTIGADSGLLSKYQWPEPRNELFHISDFFENATKRNGPNPVSQFTQEDFPMLSSRTLDALNRFNAPLSEEITYLEGQSAIDKESNGRLIYLLEGVKHPLKDLQDHFGDTLLLALVWKFYLAHNPAAPDAPIDDDVFETALSSALQQSDGTAKPWSYFGQANTCFPYHREDCSWSSANVLVAGEPKIWMICNDLENEMVMKTYSTSYRTSLGILEPCFPHSKMILFDPAEFKARRLSFSVAYQQTGDLVITDGKGAHQGFNMGPNIANSWNLLDNQYLSDLRFYTSKNGNDQLQFPSACTIKEPVYGRANDVNHVLHRLGFEACHELGLAIRRKDNLLSQVVTKMVEQGFTLTN